MRDSSYGQAHRVGTPCRSPVRNLLVRRRCRWGTCGVSGLPNRHCSLNLRKSLDASPGEDPDELLARVARLGFDELLVASQPSIEFVLTRELDRVGSAASPEARARVVHSVTGLVNAAPDALTRDIYIDTIANKLAISQDAVRRTLAGKATTTVPSRSEANLHRDAVPGSVLKTEIVIVEAVVRYPELRSELLRSGALSEFLSSQLRDAAA